ncbi:hypothetical protein [Haloarcula salina]|uniref:Uncharacterized protein n=1 Tax=Haloarcula salina TaxID=1429914 RepID=A0AA41FZQ8_9EURY|nr:hypothetical protein [Haloarcula salina]MBV0900949.1 hypothetical protein [Haloarcula salina]
MDVTRGVVAVVTLIIVGVTLLSGPLVPGVTLASEPEPLTLETGTVTVGDARLPANATLEKGAYGAASYYLDVPPATVQLSSLDGNPTLVYRFAIDELGYTRTTNHFLNDDTAETYELTLASDTFEADEIDRERYDGTVSVSKRDGEGHAEVASRNVTVRVIE